MSMLVEVKLKNIGPLVIKDIMILETIFIQTFKSTMT